MERKKTGLEGVPPVRKPFNKASGKEKVETKKRDYSEKEMLDLIERYSQFAKLKSHKQEIEMIKSKHYNQNMELNEERGMQLKNLDDAPKSALSGLKERENLEKQFGMEDQYNRNKTVEEVQQHYHQNYALSKHFKASLERQIEKSKTMDKSKGFEKAD